ncbi:hypothetical protein LAG90_04940 [Marinilongibacter aquaticus]|uniref:hypothetical protein n=1 Tax=Marinilongibacter aquaticus TaxID=2975157 RepID=UPI0021BD42E8|nr:hypothetical protein [Marinilongibacter aquaticus]UBM59995.1 hypothetical protein LAG90_04940 [Marinilongibacter aquaticus]
MKFLKGLRKESANLQLSKVVLELIFKDNRREKLPIEKILWVVQNENIGIDFDTWSITGENNSIANGIDLARTSQHEFSKRIHTIFKCDGKNDYPTWRDDKISLAPAIPFIAPGCYSLKWNGELNNLNLNVFNDLFTDPEFVCAYAFSEVDEFIQNERNTQWYESRGIPVDKSRVIRSNDKYTPDAVDISGNPGRHRQAQNMVLRSCWRMWFSHNYFKVIPKEKIEGFEGARVNKILDNGLHFIELYENPFEAAKPENRAIQKKFNEWIDIEGVYRDQVKRFGSKF